MMGSVNLLIIVLNKSDEDLLIVESTGFAQCYCAEYDEIIAGGSDKLLFYGTNVSIQAWMGFEDDLDGKLEVLIAGAVKIIYFVMFQINNAGLVNILVAVHEFGIQVIVIVDVIYLVESSLH